MSLAPCLGSLEKIFHYLDGLQERASLTDLALRLKELEIDCADLEGFIRFSDRGYMRNLVRAGPRANAPQPA